MKFQVLIFLFVFQLSSVNHDLKGQETSVSQQPDSAKSDQFVKQAQGFRDKGNFEGALRFLEIALILRKNQADSSGIANIHAIKSTVYLKQGNKAKAISSLLSAIKIHEALGDKKNAALDYNLMGAIYEKQKAYDKSEESFLNAYAIFKDFEDIASKENSALLMFNLSEINLKKNDPEKALEYGEKSAEICKQINSKVGLAKSKLSIGNAHFQFGNYELSENFYLESLDSLKDSNYPSLKANIYHQLSKVYIKQNKLKSAQRFAERAMDIFKSSGSTIDLRDTYQTLSLVYETKKEPFKALDHYKRYLEFSEISFNEESKQIEQELLTKYDSEKREAEFKLLEQEQKTKEEAIKKQHFQIISFAILGLLLAILVAGLIYYNRNIQSAKDQIEYEKERSEKLLLNILPQEVAIELKENGKYRARSFPQVSVLFADIASFTRHAETLSPEELVIDLDTYFSAFDEIVGAFKMEKIKTIGDAYMAAGGVRVDAESAAIKMVQMGLVFQKEVQKINKARKEAKKEFFEIRLGIHTGPVVAGIVGSRKFAYDIWGDTVNIASRMESSGQINKLNISKSTYDLVKDQFECVHRGKIEAKNKGAIEMYFVYPRKES